MTTNPTSLYSWLIVKNVTFINKKLTDIQQLHKLLTLYACKQLELLVNSSCYTTKNPSIMQQNCTCVILTINSNVHQHLQNAYSYGHHMGYFYILTDYSQIPCNEHYLIKSGLSHSHKSDDVLLLLLKYIYICCN